MKSKLNIKDVQFVCETIEAQLSEEEIQDVLQRFEDWEESDKNDGENWSLVVENFIYQILIEKQRI